MTNTNLMLGAKGNTATEERRNDGSDSIDVQKLYNKTMYAVIPVHVLQNCRIGILKEPG